MFAPNRILHPPAVIRALLVAALGAACSETVEPVDHVVPIEIRAEPDLDTLRIYDSVTLRVSADSLAPVLVQWVVGETDTVLAPSLVYRPRAAGTEFVHALALFAGDRAGEATRRFVARPNAVPTVAIRVVTPDYVARVPIGDTIVLAAVYADPDSDALEVRWYAGDPDSGMTNLLGVGDTLRVAVDSAADYAVVVEAQDPAGNRAAAPQSWQGYDPITPALWRRRIGASNSLFNELTATGAGLIVAGSNTRSVSSLIAFDAAGAQQWELENQSGLAPIVGGDNEVYAAAATGPGSIRRVSGAGLVEWVLANAVGGPVMLPDGSLVFPPYNGVLRRVSEGSGTVIWGTSVDSVQEWLGVEWAVGSDSAVYASVTTNGRRLIRVEPDGSLAWSIPMAVNAVAIADDSTLIVSSDRVYGVRPDGTIRWSRSPGSAAVVVGASGIGYYTPNVGSDRRLFAFRTTDGGDVWTALDSASLLSGVGPVLPADGTVIVAVGHLYMAVDAVTGVERWRHQVAGFPQASPLLTDDGLLVVTDGARFIEAIDIGAGPANAPWPMKWGGNRRRGRPNGR